MDQENKEKRDSQSVSDNLQKFLQNYGSFLSQCQNDPKDLESLIKDFVEVLPPPPTENQSLMNLYKTGKNLNKESASDLVNKMKSLKEDKMQSIIVYTQQLHSALNSEYEREEYIVNKLNNENKFDILLLIVLFEDYFNFNLLQSIIYKRMESLVKYLYSKFIKSEDPEIDVIIKGGSIKINGLSEEKIQPYLPMIAKNLLTYSSVSMELKLSNPHILAYLRLHRIQNLMADNGLKVYFEQWIENQFFPFSLNSKKKMPTSPYLFVDYNAQDQKKAKQNVGMLNIYEITKQLLIQNLHEILKNKNINMKNEDELLKAIEKAKWMKLEEYICQRFCQDTLMVFNFISKYPFSDEKQLLKRTMLKLVDLRKCINNLIAEGFINFYPESPRVILYKSIGKDKMLELYQDIVANTILNLYLRLQIQIDNESKIQIMASIQKLDNTLILF